MADTIGIYAHIPFCARRCDYCDFFVEAGRLEPAATRDFFDSLILDLDRSVAALGRGRLMADTLYIGGGTPSYVPPEEVARLLEACRRELTVDKGAEITIEANPESVTERSAEAWLAAGINRLSLGAQSFDDAVLAPRGRMHTAAGVEEAFAAARRAGFGNIGIDLIAGLPSESPQGFARGVDRLIALSPEHVSVYLLEMEESGKDTPLGRAVAEGKARAASDDDVVEMHDEAVRRLTEAGYFHYEISNFARAGRESRHNLKYWRSDPYLGIGPSAHSMAGGRRWARPAGMAAWRASLTGDAAAGDDYTLSSPQGRAREALVLALRLMEGVDLPAFARRWGMDPEAEMAQILRDLEEDGLLRRGGGRLALTPRGVMMSNEVFGRIA